MEVPHVVIVPFPAQVHIKPMFILAKLLAGADFKITFVNTHHNSFQLLQQIDLPSFAARFPRFQFKSISDGLPANHPRSGMSVTDLFWSTNAAGKPELKDLIDSISKCERPTCIIADGIMCFAIDVGKELEIPVMAFRTYSATAVWVYLHLQKLIEIGEIPIQDDGDMDKIVTCISGLDTILRRRDLPNICKLDSTNPIFQFFVNQTSKMTQASALVLNTFDELEAPMVTQLRSMFPRIYTIGPIQCHLKESASSDSSNGSLRDIDMTCMAWLDRQASNSVIYISFGSIIELTRGQLIDFWYGLVNSEQRFLWVIRPDLIFDENQMAEIPSEIMVGTKERGFVVGWAPQEDVLNHRAVGGFLTHSGWNSTLESIVAGVPMICWPQIAEQRVNSRCVSDIWRVGLDMKDITCKITVEKMVRDVMEGNRRDITKSMAEVSLKAHDAVKKHGSSYDMMGKLIEDIRSINSCKI